MTYHIAICDDEPSAVTYLQTLVSEWADSCEHPLNISCFPSAEAFLFHYADHKNYDLLLLDIEMGKLNGVELAREIRKENESVQIIFITGYPDFISDGYEVSALHYLLKPVNEAKLTETLDRAMKNLSRQSRRITLNINDETILLPVTDIQYIESSNHSIEVAAIDDTYSVKMPLYEIEQNLTQEFIRIHRCYLVNIGFVRKITRTEVILDSGKSLPLSRRLYANVNRTMMKYLKGDADR